VIRVALTGAMVNGGREPPRFNHLIDARGGEW
jgi:hypothetical protein